MPQTIKEGVVVTVISGVISATILGVVGLLLGAVSDGRVVRGMGGLTSGDLSAYAKKEEIPDISGLASKRDIPDVSAYLRRDEIPDPHEIATKDDMPKSSRNTEPTTLIYRNSFTVRENRTYSEPLWQEANFCFLTRVGGSFAGVGELNRTQ